MEQVTEQTMNTSTEEVAEQAAEQAKEQVAAEKVGQAVAQNAAHNQGQAQEQAEKQAKEQGEDLEPLRSVHTRSFAEILNQYGISLMVSTYQAHRAIVIRSEQQKDYPAVNTHFRVLDKPMGIATSGNKLAIGSAHQIWEFRNVPAVTSKLEPPEKHDACYLVRDRHTTGYVDIHEMSYIEDELWFVNTRFSCLCTFDKDHSFVPRWRPAFVSAYDTTDRCHLNGLAVRDNKPYYVTALGETNKAAGWRENKVNGGLLMDVTTNEIMTRGLSMPHSPRWYRDKLWVLESGVGRLATVDTSTGELTTVAQLPGFVRGISFCGAVAFIGLSQVRESAVFSGLEIIDKYPERICGVWAVNIETGQTIGFLKFEGNVQEIFAVSVLPNTRFPELITDNADLLKETFVLPDEALAELEITAVSQEEFDKAKAAAEAKEAEAKAAAAEAKAAAAEAKAAAAEAKAEAAEARAKAAEVKAAETQAMKKTDELTVTESSPASAELLTETVQAEEKASVMIS